MDELIYREKAKQAIRDAFHDFDIRFNVNNILNQQETVDAMPVVHGHWLKAPTMLSPEWFGRHACSVCHHFAPNKSRGTHEWLSPICPCCGAIMKGGTE